ncbi:small glutamine-rich tetratricopeptide repeat-containing protein alpha-like [Venturia canescens]|uniref:small glutamine-rich tetratricopeptide repeat-containing protein alpha-like n=1 Tax=Venturia canescens TaxID=32260 RepID=UPI001C9C3EBD|nr:small glutamine-rich tetratricopeptide repeat-containing protein alpha-like [Venturia canescens]XP_043278937.1 small glutamine-rich tetratricopeptide repeat-containing protein alpha-like [Venturia canescens]
MATKGLVASIIQFLTQQLEEGDITADSRESLEVAIQCLESAYNVQASDALPNFNLQSAYQAAADSARPIIKKEATAEEKAEAERLKTEGNNFMKEEKPHDALRSYTKAIELDGSKAVYYCNRAAVHSKMGNHQLAIKDAMTALSIDPSYSKAYARMGLAYSSLLKHKEARDCYQKASEMEPDNECYKNNIQLAEEKLAAPQTGNPAGLCGLGAAFGNIDVGSLVEHPTFVNMAREIFNGPDAMNIMNYFAAGDVEGSSRSIEAIMEAGQRFMEEMRMTNPDLVENLRRQMQGPNDPQPPQNN